jgi:hypothetical protein
VELVASALTFIWGVLRRFYWWAPAIFLDPFDFYERYLRPRLDQDIDMPSEWFPVALGCGIAWAAVLTYHDLRSKAGRSTAAFEIREASIGFHNYNHDRPEQPLDLAQIDIKGALRNRGSERAVIDGINVALEERAWPFIWKAIGASRPPTLRNSIGATIDLYYHGISVDGRSRSRDVSEIWGYVSIPTTIKVRLTNRYRVRVTVHAADEQPTSTFVDINLQEAFNRDLAEFEQRIQRRQALE